MKDQLNEGQFKKPVNIRVHLGISLIGYTAMGFAIGIQAYGVRTNIGFWPLVITWTCCIVFFAVAVCFPLQKVKDYISENDKKALSNTNP